MKSFTFLLLPFFLLLTLTSYSQEPALGFLKDSLTANNYVAEAFSFREKGMFLKALNCLDSAMTLRQRLKDTSGVANIYASKSPIYQYQGKQEKAIELLLQAIKIHKKINDLEGVAIDCNNLAQIYSNQKDYAKADEYFRTALASFENMNGSNAAKSTAIILVNLSAISLKRNNFDKALEYSIKSVQINSVLKSKTGLAQSYNSIGNAYLKLQEFPLAVENFLESLDNIQDIEYPSLKASNFHQLSKTYLEQNQLGKAEKYAHEAKYLFEKIGNKNDLKATYLTFSKIYEAKGQVTKALNYYQKYHISYEEIFNEESDRSKKELLTIYETEKKEAEIVILEKDKRLREETLKRQRSQIVNFAFGGLLLALLATGLIYYNRKIRSAKNQIAYEKGRSENLLLNILPKEVAAELIENGKYKAQSFAKISVLFADIADFTKLAENLSPEDLVNDIDEYFSAFDKIVGRLGTEKIKTIGDAYMAAGGLKGSPEEAAITTVRMGIEFQNAVSIINTERQKMQKPPFRIRIGIHTGPVVAGIVGSRKFAYDIWGDTVNIASRMESSGEVNKVNISQNTYELVKNHFECEYRGEIYAKNKGEIQMYFAYDKKPPTELP
jgi:adenylate cyclase